jgi:hypothetical protein
MPRKSAQRISTVSWKCPRPIKVAVAPPRFISGYGSFLRPAALVTMHARMGTRPQWFDDQPIPLPVPAARGPRAKVIGECWAKNAYSTGSYCPLEWSPSPVSIAEDRADYLAWWRALNSLPQILNPVLTGHVVLPPAAPEFPWRNPQPPPTVFTTSPADVPIAPPSAAPTCLSNPNRQR